MKDSRWEFYERSENTEDQKNGSTPGQLDNDYGDGDKLIIIKHYIKSVARTSIGGEVKPSVPCRRFTAGKRTLHSMSEMLCRQNVPPSCFSCFAIRWLWLLNQADSKLALR
jgi:hypothetical protein